MCRQRGNFVIEAVLLLVRKWQIVRIRAHAKRRRGKHAGGESGRYEQPQPTS
jgi:hypothetical protein